MGGVSLTVEFSFGYDQLQDRYVQCINLTLHK